MNLKKLISLFVSIIFIGSCADYKTNKTSQLKERKYYSSKGFALIYDDDLYSNKTVNKKINNEKIIVMHNFLKKNTPIKIVNPDNEKFIETKISQKAKYPKIFNLLISEKIASVLELNYDNPYIEILETKKNKTFIAKKSNTFDEEKNVAEKAPVDEIKMDILLENQSDTEKKSIKEENFILVISDFYYEDSAITLKNELEKKTKTNFFFVKKINNKKYRLFAGPFKNFNALKISYISLNNLGFEDLNIYRE
tara:strand:+ start:3535 stop:4290 length:756 start_codon:yes stop_codon:yes gene_type:complete